MTAPYGIRKIRPSEAEKFFEMRMQALKTDPNSFVATLEEEKRMSLKDFEHYLTKNFALGAYTANQELVGALVYMEQDRQKFKHIGILGGMYVHPSFRGLGIGKKLLSEMLEKLRNLDHLYGLQLKVVTGNTPAISLYESFGFSIWATEKNALFDRGTFFDQHHMMFQF